MEGSCHAPYQDAVSNCDIQTKALPFIHRKEKGGVLVANCYGSKA